MNIVRQATWTQQRKVKKLAQRSKDRGVMRRALAISWLMRGDSVSTVSDPPDGGPFVGVPLGIVV